MRRKLEAARKLNEKNKAKEKKEQKKLQLTPKQNFKVVEMDNRQGHVSTNDQDQINVQEIGNEPIDQ